MSAKTALNLPAESMAWTESHSQRSEPPLFDAGGSWGSDAAASYAAAAIAAVSATVHGEEGRAQSPNLIHNRAGACPHQLGLFSHNQDCSRSISPPPPRCPL